MVNLKPAWDTYRLCIKKQRAGTGQVDYLAKCLSCKDKDMSLIPEPEEKAQFWESGERWIPRTHWPVSLVYMGNSRPMRDLGVQHLGK